MSLSYSLIISFPRLHLSKPSPILHRPSHHQISWPTRCSISTYRSSSSSAFDLRSYWSSLISQINPALDEAVPMRYPERIYETIRYSLLAPTAKRAPPVMCIAVACDLLGLPLPAALPTACALEMVHAASLIHDDLPCMDDSPRRRGRPSSHAAFSVELAVLAGDALFPLAFQHIVCRTPPSAVPGARLLRVVAEIARAVGSTGMAAGQFVDLRAGSSSASLVDFVVEKKFGEMAGCSAACGAILGGAEDADVEKLRQYGRAVGFLYELVDDLLANEDLEAVKVVGEDENNKKRRYVKAYGRERAAELVEELRDKAMRELEGFEVKCGDRVLPLYSFVDYAVDRDFQAALHKDLVVTTANS